MEMFDKLLVTVVWLLLIVAFCVGTTNVILFIGFTLIMLLLIGIEKQL
jgi:hypothetical protein